MLKKPEIGKDASRRLRRVSTVARMAGERAHIIPTLQSLLTFNNDKLGNLVVHPRI